MAFDRMLNLGKQQFVCLTYFFEESLTVKNI